MVEIKRDKICVTEDGSVFAITPSGVLEYINGSWSKPSRSIFGADIEDARPITDDEFTKLSESLLSISI